MASLAVIQITNGCTQSSESNAAGSRQDSRMILLYTPFPTMQQRSKDLSVDRSLVISFHPRFLLHFGRRADVVFAQQVYV